MARLPAIRLNSKRRITRALCERDSAVHDDVLAGHEIAVGRGQVDERTDEVIGVLIALDAPNPDVIVVTLFRQRIV